MGAQLSAEDLSGTHREMLDFGGERPFHRILFYHISRKGGGAAWLTARPATA
jgi:hypothetical protein